MIANLESDSWGYEFDGCNYFNAFRETSRIVALSDGGIYRVTLRAEYA